MNFSSNITIDLALGLGVGLATWLGVTWLRKLALHRQILDVPNERSSHQSPVPRGGGLAIVLVVLVGISLLQIGGLFSQNISQFFYFMLGCLLIAGISLLDDLRGLPTALRFAVHSLGALLAIAAFGLCQQMDLPGLGMTAFGWAGLPLTLLWIVGLINAYNFMDGIDGIAGGQAVMAGVAYTVLGFQTGELWLACVGIISAGSSFGFLLHNWQPARIFMGDVASAFLGYLLAIIPLAASSKNNRLAWAGVLIVWPFVFDTTFTFLRRLRNREKVFSAHRSHLYQRLTIAGWAHRKVSLLYILLAAVCCGLAIVWVDEATASPWLCGLLPLLMCFLLWLLVVGVERKAKTKSKTVVVTASQL